MLPVIIVTIFIATFCISVALYLGIVERQQSPKAELKRRLARMAREGAKEIPDDLRSEIIRETPASDRLFARIPMTRDLDRRLDRAGLKMRVSLFVALTVGATLLCALLVALRTGSLLFGLLAASVGPLGARLFLTLKTAQRLDKFTEQFPDALTMIARSLRAGHSFTSAVSLVGQEFPAPLGELFKNAFDQQLLGLRITDALAGMNDRMDSLDLRFFTTVVSINSETGGNLSEVLEKLSMTIRERLRIRRQVRVFTAQGRMSGYVLGALPIVAYLIFNILDPQYMQALIKDPMGPYILAGAALLQLIGLLVIRSIIRVKI